MPSEVKEKLSHQKLDIKTAGKPGKFGTGDGQKMSFAAGDTTYTAFNPAFFEHIIAGKTLDADVEVRVSGEYTNYVVTQIYADGKPIAQASRGSGGGYRGGGGGRYNPDERASIETQVAVKGVIELVCAGKITTDTQLFKLTEQWLLRRLNPSANSVTTPVKAEVSQDVGIAKTESVTITLKALVKLAKDKGYDPNNVAAIIQREFKKAKAADLNQEQLEWLYRQIEQGKMKLPGEAK